MGSGTLPTRTDGQKINQTWFNVLTTALVQDLLPRNGSGVVTDTGGSVGSSSFAWLSAFIQALKLRANGKIITVEGPGTLAADYSMTLPGALPSTGQTLPVKINDSGTMTFAQVQTAEIADASISAAKLASGSVMAHLGDSPNFSGNSLQENGKNVVVSNTNATVSLAIVRGVHDTGSGLVTGEGFSFSGSGFNWRITFSTAFADVPALVTNLNETFITTTTASYFDIYKAAPFTISFIAIGKRA